MTKSVSRERNLVQGAGILAIVMGCGLAVWAVVRAMADVPPPGPLTAALLTAGFLEVLLGAAVLRTSRKAWAFALSLNSVLGAIGLFALPAVARSPTGKTLAAVALAGVVGIVSMLVTAKNEFAR